MRRKRRGNKGKKGKGEMKEYYIGAKTLGTNNPGFKTYETFDEATLAGIGIVNATGQRRYLVKVVAVIEPKRTVVAAKVRTL